MMEVENDVGIRTDDEHEQGDQTEERKDTMDNQAWIGRTLTSYC
jgi:hypothetical protein